jgi:hypothetical protein
MSTGKYFSAILVIVIALSACSSGNFSYKKLSDYHILHDTSKNHLSVQVIYSSGGPDYNKDRSYYYQYLVRDQKTRDTFRILTESLYELPKDSPAVMMFISADSKSKADLLLLHAGTIEMNKEDLNNIENNHFNHPEKVISNSRFRDVEEKSFPTYIGELAIVNVPEYLKVKTELDSAKDSSRH